MEIVNKFIDKYNNRIVFVHGVCTFENVEPIEKQIFNGNDVYRTEETCIECIEEGTHKPYVIPLITFLNMYSPYTSKVDDFLYNVNKLANMESNSPIDPQQEPSES